MSTFETKNNEAYCFAKEGFAGYSGVITLDDGQSFWVSVYDNDGKKGPYRAVKLKKKAARIDELKQETQSRQQPDTDFDSEVPF